jgi:hypothetical protein
MSNSPYPFGQMALRFASILFVVFVLASCELLPAAQGGVQSALSVEASLTEDSEAQAAVPPELPPMFQTSLLNPLDVPHPYIPDTCRYLRNKWNPLSAEPGTVVLALRIKNINRGTADLPDSVSMGEFIMVMDLLQAQGFDAITTRQFQAFLERNVRIPPRSVLIIQEGNHNTEFFEKVYREYWITRGWTVINGWVSDPDLTEGLIRENIELEREGFVDHQAAGFLPGAKLSDDSAKTIIARELQGSVNGLADHFAKNPLAIIWPNGGFGIRPVEAARQLRFKFGFTNNSRGPIMYNWVPLADEFDPARPNLAPEGRINDPVMTLPVFSPSEALTAIDLVRAVGKAAAAYAQDYKEIEHEYYEIVCSEEYGPMPTP